MIEHLQAMNKEEICKLLRATHTTENLNTTELQLLMRRAAHFLETENDTEVLSEPLVGGLMDLKPSAAYLAAYASTIGALTLQAGFSPDQKKPSQEATASYIARLARTIAQQAKAHFSQDN
jgi:hypothetical protein